MKRILSASAIIFAISIVGLTKYANSPLEAVSEIPAAKQSLSGKYLTSRQAYQPLTKDENIIFIDVRDTVEVATSGHPANIDAIIPLKIRTLEFDEVLKEVKLKENPTFLKEVDEFFRIEGFSKFAMVIVSCGSGIRSAIAANKLTADGYTDVWHIPDGYEGDDKPGLNTQHAWKNAGLPWSKDTVYGSEWRLLVE